MMSSTRRIAAAVAVLGIASCVGTRRPATNAAANEHRDYTVADVRFVQRMIAHHAQALAMTALLPTRTGRPDIRLLAERIEISQRSEIALMQDWLRDRGEAVPEPLDHDARHGPGHGAPADSAPMPGMLTPLEMERLAAAEGAEFERLFLELMIRHHEGALAMVADLFATPGAGEEPEIFRLASDVDADQRAEIRRLRAMLDPTPDGASRR